MFTGCKVKALLNSPIQQICLFILKLLDVRLREKALSNHVHITLIVKVSLHFSTKTSVFAITDKPFD